MCRIISPFMSYNLNQLSFKYPPRKKKAFTKKGSKLRRLDSKAEENKNRFTRKGTNSAYLKPKPK